MLHAHSCTVRASRAAVEGIIGGAEDKLLVLAGPALVDESSVRTLKRMRLKPGAGGVDAGDVQGGGGAGGGRGRAARGRRRRRGASRGCGSSGGWRSLCGAGKC